MRRAPDRPPPNMLSFQLEFDSREEALEAIETLRKDFDFAGEMSYRKTDEDAWRLTVLSEKRFRESTIEKMPGRPVAES
ncbi:MAG: hypothetical protein R6U92_08350 [Bacillota bacterium]